MPHAVDLTGEEFGLLTATRRVRLPKGRWAYLCRCACGTETGPVETANLTRGAVRSCGKDRHPLEMALRLSQVEFHRLHAAASGTPPLELVRATLCAAGII